MAISKVHAPNLHVLVGTARRNQSSIRRDVHGHNGQLFFVCFAKERSRQLLEINGNKKKTKKEITYFVSVKRKIELEGVFEEDFHSAVQQSNSDVFFVGTVSNTKHIIRHFQTSRVKQRQSLRFLRATD